MRAALVILVFVTFAVVGGRSVSPANAATVSGFTVVHGRTFDGVLGAVSAHAANDVWAVGGQDISGTNDEHPYAEHWNGHTWSMVPVPMPPTALQAWFQSISAVSATDVWAAGFATFPAGNDGFVEHWNGTRWSFVSGPHGGQIVALSPKSVWSIGGFVSYDALPEHWNGSTWTTVTMPTVDGDQVIWYTAAGRPGNVWFTGYGGVSQTRPTVMAHWDGSTWTVSVQSIPTGNLRAEVQGMSMSSTGRLYGVGFTDTFSYGSILHPFALTYDNGVWNEPSFTPYYPTDHQLWGVAATGDGLAWAVGTRDTSGYEGRTLIEHWDETTHQWIDLGGPNPCSIADSLSGVAAVGGTQTAAYAVGGCTNTAGSAQPLILHHS